MAIQTDFDMAEEPPTITTTAPLNNNLFTSSNLFSTNFSPNVSIVHNSDLFSNLKLGNNGNDVIDDVDEDEEEEEDEDITASSTTSTDAEIDSSSGTDDYDDVSDDVDTDDDMTGGVGSSVQQQMRSNLCMCPAAEIKSLLGKKGLKMPPIPQSECGPNGEVSVHVFTLMDGNQLVFSPYFFIVRSKAGSVYEARVMLQKSKSKAKSSKSANGKIKKDGEKGENPKKRANNNNNAANHNSVYNERSLLCASTPVGLNCAVEKRKSGASNDQYFVGQQSFTVGTKSVMSQSLRDQLKASEATMSRLMAQIQEERKPSPTARKVLSLLKEFFVEIKSYRYEVGRNSNKWNGVRGIAGADLERIALEAKAIMAAEPTLLRLEPPVYVIGDLHGNFKDFTYFAKAFGLWSSAEFTPAKFLFLGDYVDRGLHSIETLAFVLALKVLFPDRVFLLRGNHECSDVNGDEDTYQDGSFRRQCTMTYGRREGARLWACVNACFDQMPLAAVIDNKIFCVHAGIPREIARYPTVPILDSIAAIQRPPDLTRDLVFDLVWADPATPEEEPYTAGCDAFPPGFGPNARGPATCVFGKQAVELFCRNSGCSHLIRAHQSPKLGVDIAKNATILTVFSSSHYCGAFNRAAAVLVHDHKIDVIVSSPSTEMDTPNIYTTRDYVQ